MVQFGMDTPTLRALRKKAQLSQVEAAEQIHQVTGGKVRPDRRIIIEAEKEGTDSLSLLEGMSQVYNAELAQVLQANRATVQTVFQ